MEEVNNAALPQNPQEKERFFTAAKMAKAAMFTALSVVMYLFLKFPVIGVFPSFLEFHFSDLPALIGGFMLGPVYGCIIVLVRCLIKLPLSTTQFVGELGDFLIGISLVLPASLMYKYKKDKKGAGIGLIIGGLLSIGAALLINRFVLIPFFANKFGMQGVVGACKLIFPKITTENFYSYYIPFTALPFNTIKTLIVCLTTYFTYKYISRALSRI